MKSEDTRIGNAPIVGKRANDQSGIGISVSAKRDVSMSGEWRGDARCMNW